MIMVYKLIFDSVVKKMLVFFLFKIFTQTTFIQTASEVNFLIV